jgi:translation initiation factor eIF-2B subunit delta
VIRDSLSANERGGPSLVAAVSGISHPLLSVVNLLHDATRSEYISAVVTESGIVPPSSVAVVLRELDQ